MSAPSQLPISPRLRERVDEIVARTDAICSAHLDAEYAELCRRMTAVLAQGWRSPLERGQARTWAAGIVYAVGWVNFLADPSQEPHMTTAELAAAAGVEERTIATTFRKIRRALDLVRFDPEWTRPSKMLDNPLAWIVVVEGTPVDLRHAPRKVQEEAFTLGLIPFVPDAITNGSERKEKKPLTSLPDTEALLEAIFSDEEPAEDEDAGVTPPPPGAPMLSMGLMAELEGVLEETFETHPGASIDEMNAVLEGVAARYNARMQEDLGGLSPTDVQRLIEADWEAPESAIQLDESVSMEELQPSRTLQHARLVLEMLGERGTVKATPKGKLPRTFVTDFRQRAAALPGASRERMDEWLDKRQVINEDDVWPLHIVRILLELCSLVKRRKGLFSRTRRGEQLMQDAMAGRLFATLFRTHFRRFNLGYLDRADAVPGFQQTVGYTLYRFGRVGGEWIAPSLALHTLLLPAVMEAAPVRPYGNVFDFVVVTRFLRPLVRFGLAEERKLPRRPEEIIERSEFRKTPLFDRVLRFDGVAAG